jgi:hypothetical protein
MFTRLLILGALQFLQFYNARNEPDYGPVDHANRQGIRPSEAQEYQDRLSIYLEKCRKERHESMILIERTKMRIKELDKVTEELRELAKSRNNAQKAKASKNRRPENPEKKE